MAFSLGGLFGGASKTKGSSSSTETMDSTTESEASQLAQLTELVRAATSSTKVAGGAREEGALTLLMKQISDSFMGTDVRTAAIADSKGAMDAAMQRVLEMGLPDVRTAGTTSGGYDATTTKLLQDNVTAQAARAGAEVQADTIKNYGALQLEAIAQLIAGISAGQQGNIVQTVEDEQTRTSEEESNMVSTETVDATSTSKGKTSGSSLSLGFGGK